MMKEQKIKKVLDDELDKTTTSLNNIINEIANLTALATHNNNVNDINHNDDVGDGVDVMSTLVRSIQTSKSMDQFIDKQFKPSDDLTLGDDQLLHLVQRGSQATKDVHTVTATTRVYFDSLMLETGLSELIDKYTLHDKPTRIEHGFRNHIFSLWNDSCSMLALDTGEWTVINDKLTPRERIYRSVVYARDNKWHNDLEIIGVDGGESISTCYDGDNLIYLVGGFHNDKLLDRVDCFNIDTQQFSTVGRLNVPTRAPQSMFRNNKIIVIGGYVDIEYKVSLTNILSFNIETRNSVVLLETDFNPDEIINTCFDGINHFLIMGKASTILVDLTNIKSVKENSIRAGLIRPFIYTQSHGFVALCGGDKNQRFSFLKNKWMQLQDNNDPVKGRGSFGTCHIYH
ncbi:hypothetical protein SAMD00019534_078760 [Acytostelium subglobosum LB1]|uniref:hypothetical protein n=1 Tax=Acytostelium subglobosum LB1 TaxID=1410327 RepID=UPI0006449C99|nr:hypothetical protein SAMD00019534_078760 [Acytostelium subglobosum LB1]GAM24701.1 hypothetical protein SAMD00019534_078760 [Acytostelium subglobosum LB1]|eukprot:XP_012752370.1 hypothetical protein SAMD00019534_078760 [Acytostelium subglobosum LB1]